MIHTTTSTIQGKEITEYLGIVTGEIMVSPLATYNDLREARKYAIEEMNEYALTLKADAVLRIDISYDFLGIVSDGMTPAAIDNGRLLVSVSGTAVKVN